jgi:hypothetical protein
MKKRKKNTFKATVKTKVPANACHPGKPVQFDAKTNPTSPVWKCGECGKVLQTIPPGDITTEAV